MSKKTKPVTASRLPSPNKAGAERRLQTETIVRPFRRATEKESAIVADQMRDRLVVRALVDAIGITDGIKQARLAGVWPCGDLSEELLALLDLPPEAAERVREALLVAYGEGASDALRDTHRWRQSVAKAASAGLAAKAAKRYEAIAKHYRSRDEDAPVMVRLQATAKKFDVSIGTVRNALARTK